MNTVESLFVGRESELAILIEHAEGIGSTGGCVDFIVGEPGIGKTSLVRAFQVKQPENGTFISGCIEGGGTPPFWPWIRLLASISKTLDMATFAKTENSRAEYLYHLDPQTFAQLKPEKNRISDDIDLSERTQQFYLFQTVIDFIAFAANAPATSQPLLLIIEDLHWADEGTCELLKSVVAEAPRLQIHLIGTYRNTDIDFEGAFSAVVGGLLSQAPVNAIRLSGLTERDVADLLGGQETNGQNQKLVREICARTDGNALFVSSLVAAIKNDPDMEIWSSLPEGIRHQVGESLAKLDSTHMEIVSVAAVLGAEYSILRLSKILKDKTFNEIAEALDGAVRLNIIDPITSSSETYRFHHEVVRQTLLSSLSLSRRVQIHASCAEVLEAIYDQNGTVPVEEIFRHFSESEVVHGQEKVTHYALLAGQRAAEALDYESALRSLERGLKSVNPNDLEHHAFLHIATANIKKRGKLEGLHNADMHIEAALSPIVAKQDIELLASVVSFFELPIVVTESLFPLFEQVISLVPPAVPNRVLLKLSLHMSRLYVQGASDSEEIGRLRETLAIAESNGQIAAVAWCRQQLTFHFLMDGKYELQLREVYETREVLHRHGDPLADLVGARTEIDALGRLHRHDERYQIAQSVELLCNKHIYSTYARHALMGLLIVYSNAGDTESLTRVERLIESARPAIVNPALPWHFAKKNINQGAFDEAVEIICDVPLETYHSAIFTVADGPYAAIITRSRPITDRIERALSVLEPYASVRQRAMTASAKATLYMMDENRDGVRGQLALMDPHFMDYGWLLKGFFERYVGDAEAAFATFSEGLVKGPPGSTIAWINYFLYEMLKDTDKKQADMYRLAAADQAERLSLAYLRSLIDQSVSLGSRVRSAKMTSRLGLTDREYEVLFEISKGKTDSEIAEILFISPKTASNHVGNILKKTGAANRTEAARFAAEHDLLNSGIGARH